MQTLLPGSEAEVAEAVQGARADGGPLEVVGGGTKRALGRPMQTAATLSTTGLNGITLYEPAELVIAAQSGTPLADVERTLAESGQRLPFEPVTLKRLYGEGQPTIGAVAACNLSGPRRVHSGAARDGLIGVRLVTGHGEAIKSGGRVMKNVTGYDLVKLMSGSFGTLGVLTEVTFKVLPVPESEATLVFEGLSEDRASACMAAALGSPWEVTGAAHVPAGDDGPARTLLRLEGFESQTAYRTKALAGALSEYGAADTVSGQDSRAIWSDIADLVPLGALDEKAVWKVSTAPTQGPRFGAAVRASTGARLFYDWGGGLIWAAVDAGTDGRSEEIRAAVAKTGGHATLMRAPESVRRDVEVFQPRPGPAMALTRQIKQSFDPDRVLNPGRMYPGI